MYDAQMQEIIRRCAAGYSIEIALAKSNPVKLPKSMKVEDSQRIELTAAGARSLKDDVRFLKQATELRAVGESKKKGTADPAASAKERKAARRELKRITTVGGESRHGRGAKGGHSMLTDQLIRFTIHDSPLCLCVCVFMCLWAQEAEAAEEARIQEEEDRLRVEAEAVLTKANDTATPCLDAAISFIVKKLGTELPSTTCPVRRHAVLGCNLVSERVLVDRYATKRSYLLLQRN